MEITLTDQNFDKEIAGAEIPVLVDFFAVWCGPCAMMAPIMEEVAKEYEGKIILGKADLDQNQMIAARFGINSVPTVILFDKGKPVSGFIGARPPQIIKEWLNKFIQS